MYILVVEGLF